MIKMQKISIQSYEFEFLLAYFIKIVYKLIKYVRYCINNLCQ